MAMCPHCGEWAELGDKTHDFCEVAATQGFSKEEIRKQLSDRRAAAQAVAAAPKPVTFGTIVGGVFWGMMLFGAVVGVLWLIVHWFLTLD